MEVNAKFAWLLVSVLVAATPAAKADEAVPALPESGAVADAPAVGASETPVIPEPPETGFVGSYMSPPGAEPPAEPVATAATAPVEPRFPAGVAGGGGLIMQIDYTAGGDEVATALFADGTAVGFYAGEGLGFALGGHYRLPDSRVDLAAMIGYRLNEVVASNGTVSLNFKFIDLRADVFLTEGFWVGAGLLMHRDISYDAGGFGPNLAFEDADGHAFRVGYKWFALSSSQMTHVDEFGFEYDASSVAVEFVGRF